MNSSLRVPRLVLLLVLSVPLLLAPGAAHAETTAYQVVSPAQLFTGPNADGQLDDFVLENDLIAVLISAIGHTEYGGVSGANVLDMGRSADRVDALAELYTYFDDDWPRQASYHSLQIVEDGGGGAPAMIRVFGQDTEDANLTVITEYSLADGDAFLRIDTAVTNEGAVVYAAFELGDAFDWGGCQIWAPGYGYVSSGTTAQPWLAGVGEGVSYAYFAPDDDNWGPHGGYWSDLSVKTAYLGAGETVEYTRYLALGDGDVASAAALAHQVQGLPVGALACTVTDGADGLPIAGATIDAYDPGEAIYLRMLTGAAGEADCTMPPGNLRLVATAAGYNTVEQWVSLAEGGSESLAIELVEDDGIPPVGDELTTIMRPLLNIPAIVTVGDTLTVECSAGPDTDGWSVSLRFGARVINLSLLSAVYDPSTLWWELRAIVPPMSLLELYDLRVSATGIAEDVSENAVHVISAFKEDYYFVHVTDTHLPTNLYWDQAGSEDDSSSILDLRAIWDDLEIINPEFVLVTGDYINEGELEDFLLRRYYTRSQRVLAESRVPTYLVAGNHDLGGWVSTPPSAGTARRDWWRFYGWSRLDDPPPGAPWYTQNYSFDYGPVHYVGLEAYDNYDSWRSNIYTWASFISPQLAWLGTDLAAASGSTSKVLFYHYDFKSEMDLAGLGVDMALWGHIHRDSGNINSHPYNLATNNACRGERSYRLIRVSDGVLTPTYTLSAGSSGAFLRVDYSPANDGTAMSVSAQITNAQNQAFENGRLRVLMPAGPGEIVVTGGTLTQIDDLADPRVCYIDVNIPASTVHGVIVTLDPTPVAGETLPAALVLGGNYPNPFNPRTSLSYALPCAGEAHLAVYDVSGREVAVLLDGEQEAGTGSVIWDGIDAQGDPVASGIYMARLSACGESRISKLTLAR